MFLPQLTIIRFSSERTVCCKSVCIKHAYPLILKKNVILPFIIISNIQFSQSGQTDIHTPRDTFLFYPYFTFVQLTADSSETERWCNNMYLCFCNYLDQSYAFTLHIDRKLRELYCGQFDFQGNTTTESNFIFSTLVSVPQHWKGHGQQLIFSHM